MLFFCAQIPHLFCALPARADAVIHLVAMSGIFIKAHWGPCSRPREIRPLNNDLSQCLQCFFVIWRFFKKGVKFSKNCCFVHKNSGEVAKNCKIVIKTGAFFEGISKARHLPTQEFWQADFQILSAGKTEIPGNTLTTHITNPGIGT